MAFSINILVGETAEKSIVNVSGADTHIITPTELNSFGLTDDRIRALFKEQGLDVTDVYACEPTPGNLYDCTNWKPDQCPLQTMVQVRAVSGKILSFSVKPDIVDTKSFENHSSVEGTFSGGITHQVTNTMENNWSQGNLVSVMAEVNYSSGPIGFGGKLDVSYTHSWNVGGSSSQSVMLGSSDNISVNLKPGQKVLAQLNCSNGTLTAEVLFLATIIDGDILGRDGSMVWSADNQRGLEIPIKVTVVVGCYGQDTINLVDEMTNTELVNLPRRRATQL